MAVVNCLIIIQEVVESVQSKQLVRKNSLLGGKRSSLLGSGIVDEEEPDEQEINLIAPHFEEDDEDPLLMPRTESKEVYLQRLQSRQRIQQPTGSRVISFRGDRYGVSEPTNLLITPTGLTWKGKDAATTNQLQA
ncbi:hypothetical protein P3S68_021753 [Capsicum galapagoense]